jgi:hypothetical protein
MTAGFGAVPDELRQTAGKIADAIGPVGGPVWRGPSGDYGHPGAQQGFAAFIRDGPGQSRAGKPEFDKRFRVSAEDDRFAAEVLNPRMIQLLLVAPGSFRGFWLLGGQIDMLDPVSDHRDPAELIPALDRRCDLLDLIPTTAWA